MADTDVKTMNILGKNNIKGPVEGRCGFFVKRKQRYCKMLPAKGNQYCAEHLHFEDNDNEEPKRKRIPCPRDPKHSIFEDKLQKHLKKCNATRKIQVPYYAENINIGIPGYIKSSMENEPLYLTPVEELEALIKKLTQIHQQIEGIALKENDQVHPLLQDELEEEKDSIRLQKHLKQLGSLVSIMKDNGSFHRNAAVIEFGAGRGTLSHWAQKATGKRMKCQYFLVDRQHNRNKMDCYHKGNKQGPSFERLNIDIQHLQLQRVEKLMEVDSDIVAIGKHLCGGATDLSLRCIFRDDNEETNDDLGSDGSTPCKRMKTASVKSRFHSLVFALCCYHRCTWDTYVGLEYLRQNNVSPLEFHRMTKMASWSTCGFERRLKDEEHDCEESDKNEEKLHKKLSLDTNQQKWIGVMCKRIIDEGRLQYLRQNGCQAELIKYATLETTPENIALVVKRILEEKEEEL